VEIQNLSENIVLVVLPREPSLINELQKVIETVTAEEKCDVVVDFSKADVITSTSIGKLINLRDLLRNRRCRLILSSMRLPTRCIFKVVGLEECFDFSDNKDTALAELEHTSKVASSADAEAP